MTPVRLLATDLDGTLLNSAHRLSPATIEAVSRATAAGIDVVLASSRGPAAMRKVIDQLELSGPAEVISAQGALTGSFDSAGRLQVLHEAPLPLDVAHDIASLAGRLGIGVNWICGLDWLVSRIDEGVEHQITVLRERPILRDLAAETHPPHKILLIVPNGAGNRVAALLAALPTGVAATLSHPTFVEITAQGVDKGTALERLCTSRGISPAEVVVIGDGHNDLAMFDYAGTSISMANAAPDVRSRASMVTTSNDEDGVAVAITALLNRRLGFSGAPA